MTVLLTLPVNISNANICEIIPLKNTMLFSSMEAEKNTFKFLYPALKADTPFL